MTSGQDQERESIGELLRRLVEEARALAIAELALFRTDFYRRIARARVGALLLLIGAIMGQAAAVTLLVTLSFVLTPWITDLVGSPWAGRLGGSAVSVLLGAGIAVWAIRTGVRKLIAVVEDYEEGENQDDVAKPLDLLFDRMRERSREARDALAETVDATQARLHPQTLITDLTDEVIDYLQETAHNMIEAVRRRPAKAIAAALTLFVLMFRGPIFRIGRGIGRATRQGDTSFTSKANDKESSS